MGQSLFDLQIWKQCSFMQACPSGHNLYCPSHSCCLLQTPFKQMYPKSHWFVLLQTVSGTKVHEWSSQTSPSGHIFLWLQLRGGSQFLLVHFHPTGQPEFFLHLILSQIPKSHFLVWGQSSFDLQTGKQCSFTQTNPLGHFCIGHYTCLVSYCKIHSSKCILIYTDFGFRRQVYLQKCMHLLCKSY